MPRKRTPEGMQDKTTDDSAAAQRVALPEGLRIALLEDNQEDLEILINWLWEINAQVHPFTSGHELMKCVQRESFDVFLLDWVVPDATGLSVLEWLRSQRGIDVPILFLTALSSESDMVQGLMQGADDYIVKPSSRLEVIARINSVMRRTRLGQHDADTLSFPPYVFDLVNRRVTCEDKEIVLLPKEYEVALFLFKHLNHVVSRAHLLEVVWGMRRNGKKDMAPIETRRVDSHVSKVRIQFELARHGYRLASIYGYGYRLQHLTQALEGAQSQHTVQPLYQGT